jgi:hypothetical protein
MRDCLALLTMDVQTSFERKQQMIYRDILCDILREKAVPQQVVRYLFRLLWRKVLVFFGGGRECMTIVGYKGLPQGSVFSPFLYNIIGSCADRFIPSGCGFSQYADGGVYCTETG